MCMNMDILVLGKGKKVENGHKAHLLRHKKHCVFKIL